MKRIFLLVSLIIMTSSLFADNDKPITVEQLPTSAKQFIQKHFSESKVSYAKVENEMFDKNYDVIFTDGSRIEFDKKGEWKEVKCKFSELPDGILPEQIKNYVDQNYPEEKTVGIERDRKGYEVKLSNGLDLKFNTKFVLIGIDD